MSVLIGSATFEAVQGDITRQDDCDAIVNAANAQLRSGGGVAGAIHRAAGPGLEAECRPLAPIQPGQVVRTGGHGLPNRAVLHALGPVYGVDQPEEALLAACYRNALQMAEQAGDERIAFPALSTGAFGYPMELAARVAVATIQHTLPTLHRVRLARFVLFDAEALEIHRTVIAELTGSPTPSPDAGGTA